MKPDRLGTMTHDYKRHGTTTLFAALDVLEGTVIGSACGAPQPGFIRFLNGIERQIRRQGDPRDPRQLCATSTPMCASGWRAIPLGLPLHADSCSWLNAVEGFFAKLTGGAERGTFPP